MVLAKALRFGYSHCGAASALAFHDVSVLEPMACSCTTGLGLPTLNEDFAILSSELLRSRPGTVSQHCLDIWGTNNTTLVVPIVHVTFAPFHG